MSEFLGYLQAVRPDWRAALALYDPRREALVTLYQRGRRNLVQNAVNIRVDRLPARLVRKFFRPSAFFNRPGNRGLLTNLIQSSPVYEADSADRELLTPFTQMLQWNSCICMPLNDRDQVTALLVIASKAKNAFSSSDVADLIPVRSMASLAIAQHQALADPSRAGEERLRETAAELHVRIQHLEQNMAALEAEKRDALERCEALTLECDALNERATAGRMEVARLKTALAQHADGTAAAPPDEAQDVTAAALSESQRTVQFIREVFQVLSQEHRRETFAATLLTWYCESFGVERCSLMLFDAPSASLRIAAFRGIEPTVARNVRVRLGDGISGWVARHRKPLFIRGRDHHAPVAHTDQDSYNSDSYISVPLVYNGHMFGVLNLSNKRDGETFDDLDLDRAVLTGAVLGMTLGNRSTHARSHGTESRLQAA